jgi:hypothetical protein
VRLLALVLVLVALSGCTLGGSGGPPLLGGTPTATPTPGIDPRFPALHFGGRVVDALSGASIDDAEVHLDLAAKVPCRREGLLWQQYAVPTTHFEGRFGPYAAQRPRTDDFAYFLHVAAPGYAENTTFIGPQEARGDLGNLTVVLHPAAAVEGRAPPGTVVALDAPGFPRLAAADENGTFRIADARVLPASFVADLDMPATDVVAAPANLSFPDANATGWRLQGTVRGPSGAALAADVVARNASGALVGAARSGDDGLFTMSVTPRPADLTLQAWTEDGRFFGALAASVNGPPATRFALVARTQC